MEENLKSKFILEWKMSRKTASILNKNIMKSSPKETIYPLLQINPEKNLTTTPIQSIIIYSTSDTCWYLAPNPSHNHGIQASLQGSEPAPWLASLQFGESSWTFLSLSFPICKTGLIIVLNI